MHGVFAAQVRTEALLGSASRCCPRPRRSEERVPSARPAWTGFCSAPGMRPCFSPLGRLAGCRELRPPPQPGTVPAAHTAGHHPPSSGHERRPLGCRGPGAARQPGPEPSATQRPCPRPGATRWTKGDGRVPHTWAWLRAEMCPPLCLALQRGFLGLSHCLLHPANQCGVYSCPRAWTRLPCPPGSRPPAACRVEDGHDSQELLRAWGRAWPGTLVGHSLGCLAPLTPPLCLCLLFPEINV